ncbi:tryptophan 2,3-dioxygenase family protein [Lentzea sp. NPDC058436]|uniref:tryptophan 2,3-dioxygenase family protein n=1 Tax=Lentzea sp. NPDC058436 TaxID=3346499 RepID=UPI003659DC9A
MSVPRNGGSDYAEYLRLAPLLDLQHPRYPAEDAWTHGDEHLFIVVHQSCELMLRQVLIDLRQAARVMSSPDSGRDLEMCVGNLRRSGEVVGLVTGLTSGLYSMRVDSFASFRPLLGNASGAQSAQFRELRLVLGLSGERNGLLFEAFEALLADTGCQIGDVFTGLSPDHVVRRVADAMLTLSESVWQWQNQHLRLAAWMLGDAGGTAGSSGAAYLERRTAAPFGTLWRARSSVHDQNASTVRAEGA